MIININKSNKTQSNAGSTTTSGGNKVGFEGEQKSCKWTPSYTINKV